MTPIGLLRGGSYQALVRFAYRIRADAGLEVIFTLPLAARDPQGEHVHSVNAPVRAVAK